LKFILILLIAIIFSSQSFAQSNLAYSEEFVWHLAGRLSTKLSEVLVIKFQSISEGERAEQRMQFEILYKNYLVSCAGPLPSIAKELAPFEYPPKKDETLATPLAYVGSMDYIITPIIDAWDSRVRATLLQDYVSGKYEFLPKCINEKYLEQNPQFRAKK
jgi:hypothetical protein